MILYVFMDVFSILRRQWLHFATNIARLTLSSQLPGGRQPHFSLAQHALVCYGLREVQIGKQFMLKCGFGLVNCLCQRMCLYWETVYVKV